MTMILSALGAVLLFLLKAIGIVLLALLLLLLLLLLCPFCMDLCWENEILIIRAGAFGLMLPVYQFPQPETPPQPPKGLWGKFRARFAAWRAQRRDKKAVKKPQPQKEKPQQPPRKKARLTLEIVAVMLKGAGRLVRAVFGALRITNIRVCLGVRGEDPAQAARDYGKLQAWLYPVLGVLDRFIYLQFEELRILPDFGAPQPAVQDRVSCRVSAQALFIVAAAGCVLYEFWRKNVLDIFL